MELQLTFAPGIPVCCSPGSLCHCGVDQADPVTAPACSGCGTAVWEVGESQCWRGAFLLCWCALSLQREPGLGEFPLRSWEVQQNGPCTNPGVVVPQIAKGSTQMLLGNITCLVVISASPWEHPCLPGQKKVEACVGLTHGALN